MTSPYFSISVNLARSGRSNEILLPPQGEVVGPSDIDPVKLYVNSDEDREGVIVSARITPDALAKYLDVKVLVGMKAKPKAQTELLGVTVRNPDNPKLDQRFHGQLELGISFNKSANDGKAIYHVDINLLRFPDWLGVFAIDFGNTSTTCVVLPPTAKLFGDPTFRCLNWIQPDNDGEPQPTAIRFDSFTDDGSDISRWEVGQEVVQEYRSLIAQRSTAALTQYDAFRIGGIKRLLSKTEPNIRTVSSTDGRPGPIINGETLNELSLRRFIRRSEECQNPATNTPIGTFRRVIATRPVNYNPYEIDSMKKLYREILQSGEVELGYDEATAAAIYYLAKQLYGEGRKLEAGLHEFWAKTDDPSAPPASNRISSHETAGVTDSETHVFNMLVFDCGGGTTDIALMRVLIDRRSFLSHGSGFVTDNWFTVRPTVYGLTGLKHFAGDNMTLAALRLIRFKFAVALAQADQQIAANSAVWPAGGADVEALRNSIQQIQKRLPKNSLPSDPAAVASLVDEMEQHCRRVVPTDYGRHRDNPGGRSYQLRLDLFYQFWETAERVKRRLCSDGEDRVALPSGVIAAYQLANGQPMSIQDVTVTRAELDRLLDKPIREAWMLAADLCQDLPNDEKVHQVVLAGNGCRYPLVRELLRDVFAKEAGHRFEYREGKILFEPNDAKLACAKGAAIAERFRVEKPEDIVEPDTNVLEFMTESVNRLPFPYLVTTQGGKTPLFDRGMVIPEGEDHSQIRRPKQAEFQIYQGLRKQDPDNAIGFCLFRCEGAAVERPPEGMPDARFNEVLFRVDKIHELTAFAVWKNKEGREKLVPLPRELLPEPPNVKQDNPFEGLN